MAMESIAGLSPEREKEVIEKLATRIVASGLGTMAVMTLHSLAPLSFAAAQVGLVAGSPLLMTLDLLGLKVYEYAGLFAESTRSRENMERLICKIEELMEVEEKARNKTREARKSERRGRFARLRDYLS
ncbi:MAG: hypothetical protein V1857_02030 [archaeon]